MSQVKFTRVRNKISTAIGQGRGITASEATKRASVALETLRIPCIETIENALVEIERRFGSGAPGRANEPLLDLYILASRIIDLAGFMPDTGIDQAANALCELIDRSMVAKRTPWEAVDVNIRSLQLLRMHGANFSADRRAAIIQGLRDVIANRFATAPAPSGPRQ